MPTFVVIHCFVRVTPGRFSTFARFEPARAFISEDFPTFGMPTIMALSFLPVMPLDSYLSSFSPRISRTFGAMAFRLSPLRQS